MKNIKEHLLETGCTIDNIYLDRYVKLISANKQREVSKFQTQTHHVLPVIYFVKNNIDIDNSADNKVELLYEDHIRAHYFLALCATEDYKDSFATAFLFLIGRLSLIKDASKLSSYIKDEIDEQKLFEELSNYQSLYERGCLYQHNLNKGGKWMNNGLKQRYVRPSDILKFLNAGYIIGKLPVSEATKQKMRERTPWATGKLTVTDGTQNKFIDPEELPEYLSKGWKRGNFGAEKNKGKKMPVEAVEKMRAKRIGQPAWNKGLTKETDERILKYSNSEGGQSSQFKAGHSPWNKGQPWSEESKEKMRHPKRKKLNEEET